MRGIPTDSVLTPEGELAEGTVRIARIRRDFRARSISDASFSLSQAAVTCFVCKGKASVTVQGSKTPCPACRRAGFALAVGGLGDGKELAQ